MKRIIYTLLIAIACSISITACNEEVVVPAGDNGGTVADGGKVS